MKILNVVSKEKLADLETPVSAYLKLFHRAPDSFLLESVETKDTTGRYSIVAGDPIFSMELGHDSLISIGRDGTVKSEPAQFFSTVRSNLTGLVCRPLPELPSVGSLMGFVGYDAVRLIEKLPPMLPGSLPVARLVFPSRFLVFDHVRRIMIFVGIDSDEAGAASKVADMEQGLRQPFPSNGRKARIAMVAPPRAEFCQAVTKAQEYIRNGDIFQVVHSDRFLGETDLDPFKAYRQLRVRSPSPYMFFLEFGDFQLAGCSPETLVKTDRGKVTIMPIAGTRGRSQDPRRDKELERELLGSEKELAEHIMLVDLARNDVGRVAKYGSVLVEPYMSIQRYSHVMHIVSQVQGDLRDDADAVDAFVAGFPAGTVSGAPKVRAMEIIDELEGRSRGPYAGAIGYFGPSGVMDTCIAIRTVLFQGDRFTVQVGAGIVADSIPEMEYKEIQNKAAQSLSALQAAAEE